MKKKIVYLSYEFMGYEKEVIKLLENVMGFEVYFIDGLKYEYKYKNVFEKLLNNLYYKPFKKNLKDIMFNKTVIKELEKIGEVDCYFSIRADKFSHKIFQYIKGKNKPMYLHHWDSFSFISKQIEFLKYFDYISSFDKEEVKRYNMEFIPNFYLKDKICKNRVYEYEFFTIMKYDKRFDLLEKLGKCLKEKNINYKFIVITDRDIKSDYVDIQKDYVPLSKTYEFLSKSSGIVEIGHTKEMDERYQGGASFRIADAIGNKQKIITNYSFIKEYDIYNENNVFILEENFKDALDIFLKNNYKEYSDDIYENYSGESWIKKIFRVKKK
ncbi:hypothetical protein NON08_06130 [Cetobacterium somerae]|uniref:hypothetical protein n=1 Tax=Cetobacterium sp. NK01 TaxID=2993530 RepID=UPI0021167D3D|nr:hypothetical protein [Cetobacterium sp. NK01]MCQ8212101.1 hypothetical protein [Cetobacterium sp. NK01]